MRASSPPRLPVTLQRDRVNVLLAPDVADNAVRRRFIGRALNGSGGTGDEGNVCALGDEQSDEG